jgi:hypothetical protein
MMADPAYHFKRQTFRQLSGRIKGLLYSSANKKHQLFVNQLRSFHKIKYYFFINNSFTENFRKSYNFFVDRLHKLSVLLGLYWGNVHLVFGFFYVYFALCATFSSVNKIKTLPSYSSLHQVNQAQVENFRFKIDITFILMNFF